MKNFKNLNNKLSQKQSKKNRKNKFPIYTNKRKEKNAAYRII